MYFNGNDHLMEYNEINDVCYESNDAGAIYAGRNWRMRGNVIRYNYLHDISGFEGKGCVGVYLDDVVAPNSEVRDSIPDNFIIANLLFVNPKNPKQGEYQLGKNSLALKLGFKQVPFDKMGLYKSDNRVNWPDSKSNEINFQLN